MSERAVAARLSALHRYTITGEGASPGYFRLVEDPDGCWVQWPEVNGLITALRQDPRSENTRSSDHLSRVDSPSLVGGSDLPQRAPELASTSVENDVSRVTRFEVINETGRVYGHRPCTVQLSFQDAGRTLKVFVNWPRVNQSAASASPEEALKRARTVAAVDREFEASTDRPRAHEASVLSDPTIAAAPAPQDPPDDPNLTPTHQAMVRRERDALRALSSRQRTDVPSAGEP